MTEENANQTTECNLSNIPVEIFLHICSFIEAKFVAQSLIFVCKRFYIILSDESVWKSRISARVSGIYPAIQENEEQLNWRLACSEIEKQKSLWVNKEQCMKKLVGKEVHYAAVDTVLLMNDGKICVTGSRDRSIVVWNLENAAEDHLSHEMRPEAHAGWVWDFASFEGFLYSSSWDTYVKMWSLEPSLKEISTFQCKSAVLCVVCSHSVVAAGQFTRTIDIFDPREGTGSITSYKAHQKAVLSLAMCGDYIISASEDGSLAVWDHRARKLIKKRITLACSQISEQSNREENFNVEFENPVNEAFPMCLSLNNNVLYVGDSKGQVHLINPFNNQFELIQTYSNSHSGKVTGIYHNLGCLITSSTDGYVKISTPTQVPKEISVIKAHAGEVTGFDYMCDTLAIGTTDSAVEIWLPS